MPSDGPAMTVDNSGVIITDQNSENTSHSPSAASAALAGARNTTENSTASASQTPP